MSDRILHQKAEEMAKTLKLMDLTLRPLESDVNFAMTEWKKDRRNQFWRRCVTRCVFAYVESLLWKM